LDNSEATDGADRVNGRVSSIANDAMARDHPSGMKQQQLQLELSVTAGNSVAPAADVH
jgi:hypothetical protein